MEDTCKIAKKYLKLSGERYKHHYDRRAKNRELVVGDKVLVLLPTNNDKPLLNWKGPYEVTEKVGSLDYRMDLNNGRTKIFHANLKKYESRTSKIFAATSVIPSTVTKEDELIKVPDLKGRETYTDVVLNPSLPDHRKLEMQELCKEFSDILTNQPGCTDIVKHKIELTVEGPVRERPYAVPFAVQDIIEKEVESMLKAGIIEPSNSKYCAPVVLVGKPDSTYI